MGFPPYMNVHFGGSILADYLNFLSERKEIIIMIPYLLTYSTEQSPS
jgi:hypothetical protein